MVAALWMVSVLPMLGQPSALLDTNSGGPSSHWRQVRVQTACEAMQDDYCLGRYGFIVQSDGEYTAGPSPNGRKVEGRIKPDELQRLHQLMGKFSVDSPVQDRTPEQPTVPGIKDQIDIEFAGWNTVRAYEVGGAGRKILHSGAWDDARRLHDLVHHLLAHYYPHPFPQN